VIKVFYDGQCGLCSKEINYYRKIAPAGVFDWLDITSSNEALNIAGVSLSEGLRVLHVIDQKEQLHVGVDAFILIWSQLKYWKVLGRFVALPGINQFASLIYRRFADWRFSRLSHCQLADLRDSESQRPD